MEIIALETYFCYKADMKSLTTSEAAEYLGISVQRVRALITAGRLPAEKFGRDYVVKESDLKFVEDRKPGRPPKPKEEAAKGGKVVKSQTKRKNND